MSKTCVFTTITPLPAGITRQSVIEMYHNHVEMIELNPLVVERFRCKPPNYAPAEEYYSTWYTIKDKVSYLPGGLATGSVSYHAVFHDLPDSLQTHVYAPLGLDIRAKWSVGGQLPGEPKQPVELGLGIPREGLYIREDVRMKCNIMMLSFVKKTFKESHAKLVDRLVEKAHVRESSLANERLKALKNLAPRDRMGHGDIFIAPPPGYHPSPAPAYSSPAPVYSSPAPNYSSHSRNNSRNDSCGHESNHSPVSSPGLSQASTLTSQSSYLSSPPCRPAEYDKRAHRESFNFQLDHKPVQSPERNLLLLPATTYDPNKLPATTYDPHKPWTRDVRRDSTTLGAYHATQPHIMELDGDVLPPPVPRKDRHFIAELPA